MNERRSFLRGAGAFLLGLLGLPTRADAAASYNPTVAERDSDGNCVARAYKLSKDGCYYEVSRKSLRPGDRMIMLGLDGKRLWCARSYTVGPQGYWKDEVGEDCVDIEDINEVVDLIER